MNNVTKIIAASTLTIMTILSPVSANIALASHHHHHSETEPTRKNTKIKVDTKKNRITLYKKEDGKWVKVKTEKCCTGKDGATRKGTFKTRSKESSFTKEGKSYNYVTYFDGNRAIHSTPQDEDGYHNSSLGHSRSHGCVRVEPETAKWIYKNVKKGTTIEVE